ncbi:MAG: NAD-dependent epimerase/dehydratase family protein [Candidatus Anstonellaceae archaeon]
MTFLITGGAGFIGSNLAGELFNLNKDLIIVDNFHTGSKENIKDLEEKKVKVFKKNSGQIEELKIKDIQAIFHNGIYSSSPMYKENPRLVSKALDEFIAILEYCRKKDVKLIFASTSSLYNGVEPPHKEDAILKPTDFYSEVRIAMERIARLYSDIYGLNVIALRYFSVYGPKEKSKGKYANLVSQFLWAMLENKQPLIYGDGKQTRDFVYVDDIIKANVCALNSKIKFGIYNVGTGRAYSLNQLVEILNKKLNKNIKPIYLENKIKNYVQHTLADITKAKNELGFEASISLEEGIGKLINFYKK